MLVTKFGQSTATLHMICTELAGRYLRLCQKEQLSRSPITCLLSKHDQSADSGQGQEVAARAKEMTRLGDLGGKVGHPNPAPLNHNRDGQS